MVLHHDVLVQGRGAWANVRVEASGVGEAGVG